MRRLGYRLLIELKVILERICTPRDKEWEKKGHIYCDGAKSPSMDFNQFLIVNMVVVFIVRQEPCVLYQRIGQLLVLVLFNLVSKDDLYMG